MNKPHKHYFKSELVIDMDDDTLMGIIRYKRESCPPSVRESFRISSGEFNIDYESLSLHYILELASIDLDVLTNITFDNTHLSLILMEDERYSVLSKIPFTTETATMLLQNYQWELIRIYERYTSNDHVFSSTDNDILFLAFSCMIREIKPGISIGTAQYIFKLICHEFRRSQDENILTLFSQYIKNMVSVFDDDLFITFLARMFSHLNGRLDPYGRIAITLAEVIIDNHKNQENMNVLIAGLFVHPASTNPKHMSVMLSSDKIKREYKLAKIREDI